MKVGDLVKRRSTGKVDIVVEVPGRLWRRPNGQYTYDSWVRVGIDSPVSSASNWEVVSESR